MVGAASVYLRRRQSLLHAYVVEIAGRPAARVTYHDRGGHFAGRSPSQVRAVLQCSKGSYRRRQGQYNGLPHAITINMFV